MDIHRPNLDEVSFQRISSIQVACLEKDFYAKVFSFWWVVYATKLWDQMGFNFPFIKASWYFLKDDLRSMLRELIKGA